MNEGVGGNWRNSYSPARVALIVVSAAAIVVTLLWMRDRPVSQAETQLKAGDAESALATINSMLQSNPDNQRALLLKARSLAELKRWPEATAIFSQVGASGRDDMRAWATALLHQRRWREALPILEQMLEADPQNADLLRSAISCRHQLGDMAGALQAAEALTMLPGHEAVGRFQQGVIYRAAGDSLRCLENWSRVVDLKPRGQGLPISPAEFYYVYGEELFASGRARAALAAIERSLRLSPNVDAYDKLGEIWSQIGDAAKAAEAWQAALAREPSNPRARIGLAELALSRDDAAAAIEWLQPVVDSVDLDWESAYLMQRAMTIQDNDMAADKWRRQSVELRKAEKLRRALVRKAQQGASSRAPLQPGMNYTH